MSIPFAEFDTVIVGAGSAGCVLAHRLAGRGDRTIALIEAGGRDHSPWFRIPVGFYKTRNNPSYDWCFKTEPEQSTGGRTIDWPRGRVLGGSSSLNGMLYVRGHRADYDGWASLGLPGWNWSSVEPYFKRAEAWQETNQREYGSSGPLPVSRIRFDTPLSDLMMRVGQASGIAPNLSYNNGDNSGLVRFDVTMRKGQRGSTARSYLADASIVSKIQILESCNVLNVCVDDGRAAGVLITRPDGTRQEIRARQGVVLCAGTIGSPSILHHSGIGPGDVLQKAGITVLHSLRGVGQNLQDHFQARLIFDCPEAFSINSAFYSWTRRILAAAKYAISKGGLLAMSAAPLGAFLRSQPHLEAPDLQWHVFPFSLERDGKTPKQSPQFSLSVCLMTPKSRGMIVPASNDPLAAPLIYPGYLADNSDCDPIVRGMEQARQFLSHPEFVAAGITESRDTSDCSTHEDLISHIARTGASAYHPVGTCAMGTEADSVVDANLKVSGIDNLWVADASVMPRVTRGNTNAPTIMIAEKAADMIS